MEAISDAELVNGTVAYLTENEGTYVDDLIESLSKERHVAIFKHKIKEEEFGVNIRMARRFRIDAILSKSLKAHFVTVKDDPDCSLTKIVKLVKAPYVIDVHHVRSKEQIEKDRQTISEKISKFRILNVIVKDLLD